MLAFFSLFVPMVAVSLGWIVGETRSVTFRQFSHVDGRNPVTAAATAAATAASQGGHQQEAGTRNSTQALAECVCVCVRGGII